MSLDLVVCGATGRMGRAVGRLIGEASGVRLVGGIARGAPSEGVERLGYPEIRRLEEAGDLLRRARVVIDFSAPAALDRLLALHGDGLRGRALVVGTTGLEPALEERLDGLVAHTAVLTAPNFSVGVNLLLGLVATAARVLAHDRYDVEIVETHHGGKEDAPSGTALALGQAVASARGAALDGVRRDGRSGRTGPRPEGEIGIHAVRGGDVIGEHTVTFLGGMERLVLGHSAHGRDLFAHGAILAARWLADREPARYTMADVLGLNEL